MEIIVVYAALSAGRRFSFLRLLAAGWRFSDAFAPAPMLAHHGRYSVLMETAPKALPESPD